MKKIILDSIDKSQHRGLNFRNLLYNNEARAFFFQAVTFLIVIALFYSAIGNLFENIEQRGIQTGFSFLKNRAGFDILPFLGNYVVDYTPESPNLSVFYVGLINTLVVAFFGIILSTVIGLLIGIARLSNNYLISKLAGGYIELFRNIPVLLQILFWYNLFINAFPHPKQSFSFFDIAFLNQRGLYMPKPIPEEGFIFVALSLLIGIIAAYFIKKFYKKKHELTGIHTSTWPYTTALVLGLPLIVYLILGSPLQFDLAVLGKFNLKGGMTIVPEFLALAFALSVYTATYIAEAIRSGIEAVDKGQKEAAAAIGLSPVQSLKLIVLPQALRVAIPPTINQYLNLTKNSSLATVIGYPELMSSFGGTVLNQVGQAVEILGMAMLVYLVISLVISLLLNYVNKKMAIQGR
ncbi:ABC transporter permease subunit [Candidatus Thioglobus sp.]|jgi:general L-amino acid transport system permease protein|nr:ABC transporter permease subunit [Candidatus Thioglobus sp.]|tara:strand:+ start:1166 stop:2386 length:1221 start_codon:yes stop_codon:yes gene_type:complete